MESVQLPHILLEKMPSLMEAPSSLASGYSEEFTSLFNDYSFADQFLNSIEDDASSDASGQESEAELAARQEQLIMELEQEIKDESWLDAAPIIFEPTPSASPLKVAAPLAAIVDENRPKNTEELLFEFDAVCNAVGITPPASPPASDLLEGAPIYYVIQGEEIDASMLLDDDSNDDFIDELVRSHSSSIPDDDFSMASSSPRSDISSSPRSESSFDVAGFDDEEWRPALEPSPVKRKKRPYGRPLEEKRVRKKEQNKNAATRYRQKKKQQLEVILGEEEGLKAINLQLQTKLADTKREINYLKKLMREVLVAKGVLI